MKKLVFNEINSMTGVELMNMVDMLLAMLTTEKAMKMTIHINKYVLFVRISEKVDKLYISVKYVN